jgi:hypothetical protein
MHKDQFIVAAANYHKSGIVLLLISMSLAGVCTSIYAPNYYHRFEGYLDPKFDEPTSAILAIVPLVPPMFVALCLVVPVCRKIERKLGVTCPHCSKNVAQFRTIVIATCNCPFCGLKLLDDNL